MTAEPPHPGEFIRDDILQALRMTIKDWRSTWA
jgi:plasmid maintenance system antidote protein VapI